MRAFYARVIDLRQRGRRDDSARSARERVVTAQYAARVGGDGASALRDRDTRSALRALRYAAVLFYHDGVYDDAAVRAARMRLPAILIEDTD